MGKKNIKGISTIVLHTANHENDNFSHTTPIYATSTFTFSSADEGMARFKGDDKTRLYTRWGNPTFNVAEKTIEALEARGLTNESGAPLEVKALLHSSGQAAISTLFFSNLSAGDCLISHYSLYGGSQELMQKVLNEAGVKIILIDIHNEDLLLETIKGNPTTKLIHLETPANPTLQCVDIEAVCKIARAHGIKVSVDNTVATPYLQQPFALGADYVFHSATKFLNGHGSALNGVLVGKDLEFMNTKVWKWHALLGGNSNAFDAYLLIQGMKTLELRMEKHCSNAKKAAEFLSAHDSVEWVRFPGLEGDPSYELSEKYLNGTGGTMVVFGIKGGKDSGQKFIDNLKMFRHVANVGDTRSLAIHPASTTHSQLDDEALVAAGSPPELVRLSIGIENIEDIIEDLSQALESTK